MIEELEYDYDVTWKLANPSFEVDNVVADLTADDGRGYSVATLTGWDLSLSEVDHCDLMTKEATETDNNLGVPSAAAKLVAGDESKSIIINGTSAGSETSHPIAELTEWSTNELVFTVSNEEGDEVELGVDFDFPKGANLTAYHCYLALSSGVSPVRGFISFPNTDGEATAIVAVESEEAEADGTIYDLSGRKVSKAVKGVYIQNGKKVLVK